VGKGLSAGALTDSVVIEAKPTGPGAKGWTLTVPVQGMLYELTATGEVDLGGVAVDPKSAREVAIAVPIRIRPATPGLIAMESKALRGPVQLKSRAETAGTQSSLVVTVPSNAPRGVYRTALTVRGKLSGTLRPREVLARLEVWTEPEVEVVEPKPVEVTALGSREVDAAVGLGLKYPSSGATLVVQKGALVLDGDGPALAPDDYELVPEEGWDGKRLGAGKRRTLTVRIYVSSDVRNGTYRGKLDLTLKADGRPDGHAVVPVVVRVAR
jgi:hypothetical protein